MIFTTIIKNLPQSFPAFCELRFFCLFEFHCELSRADSKQLCSIFGNHEQKPGAKKFAKFTGKHLCKSLFFNKIAGLTCNIIKKKTLAQVFSCEFCEFFKNTFFTEHFRTTAPGFIEHLRWMRLKNQYKNSTIKMVICHIEKIAIALAR